MSDLLQFDLCGERISNAWKSAVKDCPPPFFKHAAPILAMIFYNGVVSGLQTGQRCNEEQAEKLVSTLKAIYQDYDRWAS